jgi:hypothetical protein
VGSGRKPLVVVTASDVLVVTSVNRLVTACPYSAPHVEAPDPDIIVRRFRDLGKDHDPSDASAGQVDPMPG